LDALFDVCQSNLVGIRLCNFRSDSIPEPIVINLSNHFIFDSASCDRQIADAATQHYTVPDRIFNQWLEDEMRHKTI